MNKDTLYVKRKRPTDMLLLAAIYVSATLAVALLLGIILYVFVKGIRTVNWAFLTTVTSARKQTTGIAGNLLNTLYIIVITLLIATPIGVGSAIYLNEYAKPGKLVSIIEFTTETLSGIPSIIFGLFGMIFFGETLGFGYSLLTGSFTVSFTKFVTNSRNVFPVPFFSSAVCTRTALYAPWKILSAVLLVKNRLDSAVKVRIRSSRTTIQSSICRDSMNVVTTCGYPPIFRR